VALDADPEVMRFLGDGRPRRREQVQARHPERLAEARHAPGLGFWIGSVDGEPVGWWHLLGRPDPRLRAGRGRGRAHPRGLARRPGPL